MLNFVGYICILGHSEPVTIDDRLIIVGFPGEGWGAQTLRPLYPHLERGGSQILLNHGWEMEGSNFGGFDVNS